MYKCIKHVKCLQLNSLRLNSVKTYSSKSNIDFGPSLMKPDDVVGKFSLVTSNEDDLINLGSKLAEVLEIGDVILLLGDLGSGKTTFTRGVIRKIFDEPNLIISSPTYLLSNKYDINENHSIYHIDLYRLPTNSDMSILDIPNIYKKSVCLIEWPQRMANNLPQHFLEVNIHVSDKESRNVTMYTNQNHWYNRLSKIFNVKEL